MRRFYVSAAAIAAGLLCFNPPPTAAQSAPGTTEGAVAGAGKGAVVPATASGLKVFWRKYGLYRVSVDAAGSNGASHVVDVVKPTKDAKVVKAYLMAASFGTKTITNDDVRLNGRRVTWIAGVYNDVPPSLPNFFHSVLADVTSIVKPVVDPAGVGTINFKVEEVNQNLNIDGEILAVVFSVPSDTEKRTIALLFGGQQLRGDRFEITLAKPIGRLRGERVVMGLGTSYSYQTPSVTNQVSLVTVNGNRVSSSSGGQDDGEARNGGLITAGGLRDSIANPPNPLGPPTNFDYDDELYNLLPFMKRGDTVIRVDTINPSNDDNIFFAWFDISARGQVNKDTDGDGLLDHWEKNGYDHDGDGRIDVPIHRRGANYRCKDIFIAYAWMRKSASERLSHEPSATVLDDINKAFRRAPVKNPLSTCKGIKLHWWNLGGVPHDDDLNPVWDEFDAIMDPLVNEAQRKIYHRMLAGHGYSGGSSSGLSRGIPASDFIETLGRWSTNPGTRLQRAGTIMHELGHNLGLRHGGPDHENYKPNHLSIMSYANQVVWLIYRGKPRLDYERWDLRELDENNLNERKGLNRVGPDRAIRRYGVRWYNPSLRTKNNHAHRNIDFDSDGNDAEPSVAIDINRSGGRSILRANYPEWANIVYNGGNVGPGAPSEKASMMTDPSNLDELNFEEYQEMMKNMVVVE